MTSVVSTSRVQTHVVSLVQVATCAAQVPIGLFWPTATPQAAVSVGLEPHTLMTLAELNQSVLTTNAPVIRTDLWLTQAEGGSGWPKVQLEGTGQAAAVQFYAGFPVGHDREIYGVLAVADVVPHRLNAVQQVAIAHLAEEIGFLIASLGDHPLLPARDRHDLPKLADSPLPSPAQPSGIVAQIPWDTALTELSLVLQDCLSSKCLAASVTQVLTTWLPLQAFQVQTFHEKRTPQILVQWQRHPGDVVFEHATCQRLKTTARQTLSADGLPACPECLFCPVSAAACVCYPLITHQQVIGSLLLQFSPDQCSREQLNHGVLSAMGQQIGAAVGRLRVVRHLRSETLRDPLTQLFNRRYMMTMLYDLLARVSYGRYQVALLLVDIDYFKRVNDTYGHDVGDRALKMLGLFLKGHARPNDVVCRYGGEEFALILPNISLKTAEKRAQQLRRGIRYLNLTVGNLAIHITLSIGVAIAPIDAQDADALIKAADIALYAAKNAGRDRVVCSQSRSTP